MRKAFVVALCFAGSADAARREVPEALVVSEDEREAYRAPIATLLKSESFDELERIADSLRHERRTFSTGSRLLSAFYEALSPAGGYTPAADRDGKRRALEKWRAAKPLSLTPRVAVIHGLVDLAWESRGVGFAESVSAESRKGLESRLEEAWETGVEAERLASRDPGLYEILMVVGVGLGKPRSEMDRLFEQGIVLDSEYMGLYLVMARYLTPQWYGSSVEFERFASWAAARTKGKFGDGLYARLALEGMVVYGGGEIQMSPVFDWSRIKRGFADLERLYPRSSLLLNAYCYLALKYKDYPTAAAAYRRLGGHWSKDSAIVWQKEETFDIAGAILEHPDLKDLK